MVTTLVSQAAALLTDVLGHELASPCSLEQIESCAYQYAHAIARHAVQQHLQTLLTQVEEQPPECSCGQRTVAEQRRGRALLLLVGLIRVRLRRYRCPACGTWTCPGEQVLSLRPKQRMTRSVEELLCRFGLSWGTALAARLVAQVLPAVSVSAKTVERSVKRCAGQVEAREEREAVAATVDERAVLATGPAFDQPQRIYVGLDGVLVRGRQAKRWVEIQVGSLWSGCREIPGRRHPRREIPDATVVARAKGWEALGRCVWRMFVWRGGAAGREPEIVVAGDGAEGIKSVWQMHFGAGRLILDPWHLWEKVKERSRQVLGKGEAAWEACQQVYEQLKVGAVESAVALVREWPVRDERSGEQKERLLAYLERNRESIPNYEELRATGYQVGAGLTEKANDLVVVPRMKNGKMHWSREGANAVALLRAWVISQPDAAILPT